MTIRLLLFAAMVASVLNTAAQSQQYQEKQCRRLQSELNEHTVFGLGEEGHGYESINEAKALLVEFLKQQMGVNGVVFESSFALSAIAYLRGDSLSNRLKYSLYPFWNTVSVKTSLEPFYQLEKLNKPLIMGCDVQEDCRFTNLSRYLVNKGLIKTNISKLHASDSILAYYIGKDFNRRGTLTAKEYIMLADNYTAIATELKSYSLPEISQKLLLRSLENRIWLCRYLTLSTAKERMYFRDSLMGTKSILNDC